MSAYDAASPPRSATGNDDSGWRREPYARVPSPRHDDFPPAGGADEPGYGHTRRGRSPDEGDRRGKRRRSPSPVGRGGGDTYIPSYNRERSPPSYRDRRGDPASFGGSDRYGGRDDSSMGGAPGYDRRGPPLPRSQLRPPQELPYLAPFAYYRDYMREEDQRLFDDKDKLEESYKKYKSSFYRKTNRMFFDDVKTMSWCKEKYGITEEEVNERKRLKNKGREGKVETFLSALEGGEYDEISFDGKVFVPRSPSKIDAKLPEDGEDAKDAAMKDGDDEESKPEIKAEGDDAKVVKIDEDTKPSGEGDATMQESENQQPKVETDDVKPAKTEQGDNATNEAAKIPESQEEANGKNGAEDNEAKKGEEDSIMIPGNPYTLLIKSLSPEISRADLEAHCKQVDGFDYIALGEPNVTKRFHRIGWVVFKAGSDMESAVEKLCESKINDFTLHMSLADKPTYQRLRQTPSVMASADRIRDSLDHVKKIVARMEAEADNDTRGSEAIEKRLAELSSTVKDETKIEGDDANQKAEEIEIEKKEQHERRSLDLYIQYLRSVFHTCYYCITVNDFEEELIRKCVKHVRRNLNAPSIGKNRKENDVAWVKNFDEKILLLTDRENVDPLDYGGENSQEELSNITKPHITIEDEGKFRCKECKKLFKAAPFVEKHILNKHPELVGDKLEEVKYFNNFVLDPAHPMPPLGDSPQYSNNPNHPANAAFYGNGGMASTFGAFNQMFNPTFNAGYGMMAPYGNFGAYNPMFQPMGAGYNAFGGPPGAGMYGAPVSGNPRSLGDRIGDRQGGYGMDGGRGKRQRRDYGGPAPGGPPPPPPKGAKIDPRAGRLHAYTDLDGPPTGGGGEDLDMLDY